MIEGIKKKLREIVNKLELYILTILHENQGRLARGFLIEKVKDDFQQGKGAYAGYSSPYYLTRFDSDLSELIKKGFVREVGENLEVPPEIVGLLNKFQKPVELTPENIRNRLQESLNSGRALELDILRLVIEEIRDVRVELRKMGWTEKATNAGLDQLVSENLIKSTPYGYGFKSADVEKHVRDFFEGYRNKTMELSLDKKDEFRRFRISFLEKKVERIDTSSVGVTSLLLDFTDECKRRGIEVVSTEFVKMKVLFNQRLYEISFKEEELSDIPYFDIDRAFFICTRVAPEYFYGNFCSGYNADKRKNCAIYTLKTFEKFNVIDDMFFEFFEKFLKNKFNVEFAVPVQIFDKIQEIANNATQTLQKEKEELSKKVEELGKKIDEGFAFTQPSAPWPLGTKFDEFLRKAKNIVRVSNPYCDNSTFDLLRVIGDYVKINILVTHDEWLSGKVRSGILSSKEIKKAIERKRVEVKRISDLHSRFVTIDDGYVLFSSTDLQTKALMSKYQYGLWTNNSDVVRNCTTYFDSMWGEAEPFDLVREVEAVEKKQET